MSNTNIASGKMFAHIDRVFGEQKPITADVFLDNYCNNKCPYCTFRRWELEPGARSMRFQDFVTYAERMTELGVRGIILTGGGEPTVAKDFDAITMWLTQHNYHWGINTNFNILKCIKPDYLKVSLDGWDEESYHNKRGVYAYGIVRKNIEEYAAWKAVNSPNTSLGIQVLAQTVEEAKLFYEANRDLPVDYISIRPMESTNGTYYKNLPEGKEYKPANIIREIKRLAALDKRVVMNYKWNMLDTQEDCCTAQWAQIAVNENGEVMYCCHKPYQIVGHIMDDDIMEKKALAGTNMKMCDIPCRMTAPNAEVRRMLEPKKDVGFI